MSSDLSDKKPRVYFVTSYILHLPMDEPTELPPCNDEILLIPRSRRRRFPCGHLSPARFAHNFFGEVLEANLKRVKAEKKCGDCILAGVRSQIIRCAKCGLAIFPKYPVALYANDATFNDRPWKQTVGPNDQRVIGCFRRGCRSSEAVYAGQWDGEKFQPQFDGKTLDEHVQVHGGAIILAMHKAPSPKHSSSTSKGA